MIYSDERGMVPLSVEQYVHGTSLFEPLDKNHIVITTYYKRDEDGIVVSSLSIDEKLESLNNAVKIMWELSSKADDMDCEYDDSLSEDYDSCYAYAAYLLASLKNVV